MAAGHRKLGLRQSSVSKGVDYRIEPPANLRQDAYSRLFQGGPQPPRNRPANQDLDTQFAKALDDPFRLLFEENDFPPFHFGSAFHANEHQARRHVKDRRHAALTVGNGYQHA